MTTLETCRRTVPLLLPERGLAIVLTLAGERGGFRALAAQGGLFSRLAADSGLTEPET